MKRLQRSCFLASAGMHGLLLLLLLVGSAFVTRKAPVETPPAFEFLRIAPDVQLVEEDNVVGGGNPQAAAAPPAALPKAAPAESLAPPPPREVQPEPEKPKAEPPKAEPEERIKPPEKQPEPARKKEPDPDAFDISKAVHKTIPAPKRDKTDKSDKAEKAASAFDLSKAEKKTIKTTKETKPSPDGEEGGRGERQVASARTGAVSDALRRLQGGLSSVGGIADAPGPGGNALSYRLALQKRYQAAWVGATTSGRTGVLIEVKIAKDGTVLDARIIRKSGNADYDLAAERTIRRVKNVDPLPASVKEASRTYRIEITPNEFDRG